MSGSSAPSYDWSRFVKRVDIKADPVVIYRALTTREGLESWFLRKALLYSSNNSSKPEKEPVIKGDRYEWYWHGWGDDTSERGDFLEANGKDRMGFSFGKAGNVFITVKFESNESVVELIQENIPVDEESKVNFHLGCTKGWVFYLANLKSILEGGIDLRNKNVSLKNMINA
jgi:uncharacterized protein YndB with AHSA1/START domain